MSYFLSIFAVLSLFSHDKKENIFRAGGCHTYICILSAAQPVNNENIKIMKTQELQSFKACAKKPMEYLQILNALSAMEIFLFF